MPNPFQNVNAPAARKMVTEMSNAQTVAWIGVAFLVHVVVVGATSVGYIRDTWIDPQGADARAKAEAAAAAAPANPAAPTDTPAATKPDATLKANKPPTTANPDDAALIEKNKNNPVIKNITDTAKPSETPKAPARNGFDLDDGLK